MNIFLLSDSPPPLQSRWTKAKVASLYFPRVKEKWVEVPEEETGGGQEGAGSNGPIQALAAEGALVVKKSLLPMGTLEEEGNEDSSNGTLGHENLNSMSSRESGETSNHESRGLEADVLVGTQA